MDILPQPLRAIDLYNLFIKIIQTVQKFWYFISTDLGDLVAELMSQGSFVPDWILGIISDSLLGFLSDFSILDLCFGSGVTFVLVLIVIKFFTS